MGQDSNSTRLGRRGMMSAGASICSCYAVAICEVNGDMNFLRWIKSRFELVPINRVRAVNCDDRAFKCRWAGGSAVWVKWNDVQRVVIRTTDGGPFDDDVFFVVEASGRRFVIPQQAAGAGQLLEHFQRLPGFDNEAVINAMGCAENKEFLCWERKPNSGDD